MRGTECEVAVTTPEERLLARILCPPPRPTRCLMRLLLIVRAGKTYDRMEEQVSEAGMRRLNARRNHRRKN